MNWTQFQKDYKSFTSLVGGFSTVVLVGAVISLAMGMLAFLYPLAMNYVVAAFRENDFSSVIYTVGAVVATQLTQEALGFVGSHQRSRYAIRANRVTLLTLYERLLNYPLGLVDRHKRSGELFQKLMDTWRLGSTIVESSLGLLSVAINMVVVLIVIGWHDLVTALLLVLVITVYIFSTSRIASKVAVLTDRSLKTLSQLGGILFEGINRLTSVKALGAVPAYISTVNKEVEELTQHEFNRAVFSLRYGAASGVATIILQAFIVVVVLQRSIAGSLEVGTAIAVAYLATRTLSLAGSSIRIMQELREGQVMLRRFSDLLDNQVEQSLQSGNDRVDIDHPPKIEFINVNFSYGDRDIIRDVSFSIESGGKTALVGRSGAGKSTLIKLLLGLYAPTSGRILIDGKDICNMNLNHYRSQLGIILQADAIFPGTVLDNLTFGLQHEITHKEAVDALETARIWEIAEQLPNGLHEWIKTSSLSGGEQQRLIVARTILRKTNFLLMDEPTSALDSATEREVTSLLSSVVSNATSLTIAHRLSTIKTADQILVLNDGMLDEMGVHQDLIERNGRYSEMYSQSVIG